MSNSDQETVSAAKRFVKGCCSSVSGVIRSFSETIGGVIHIVEDWLVGAKRASYGLAVTRILLGAMIVGAVLSNLGTASYTFGPGAAWTGQLTHPESSFAEIWPFSIVNAAASNKFTLILVMISLLVCAMLFAVGYRTRLVMVPLFVLWVGFLSINTYVQDQSDNLTRISFIALIFTGLSDRWSLDARRRKKFEGVPGNPLLKLWRFQPVLPSWITTSANNFALVVIIVQLCFVYASGGLYKAAGDPWRAGTAVYDPIMTQRFGTWPILSDLVTWWGPAVAVATIGTVLIQVSFPFMMLNRFTRLIALFVILCFHLGIAVLMGLPWFSLSMIALDAVFIRNHTWIRLEQFLKRTCTSLRI